MKRYTDHTDRIVLREEAWQRHLEALRNLSVNDNHDGPSDLKSIAERILLETESLLEGENDPNNEPGGEHDTAA